jgi:hypothetical protein
MILFIVWRQCVNVASRYNIADVYMACFNLKYKTKGQITNVYDFLLTDYLFKHGNIDGTGN